MAVNLSSFRVDPVYRSKLTFGGRLMIIGFPGPVTESVLKVLPCCSFPYDSVQESFLLTDIPDSCIWGLIRQIRFFESYLVSKCVIQVFNLENNTISYGPGTEVLGVRDFLAMFLSNIVRQSGITENELKSVRAMFLKDMPPAVKGRAVGLWHDLRNDCRLLLDSWEALVEDPEDSLSFSTNGRDDFAALAERSGEVGVIADELSSLISLWFPGRNLVEARNQIKEVFRAEPRDSSVLSIFLNYPSPRHPQHEDEGVRRRYKSLVEELTSDELMRVADDLSNSLKAFATALNECFRGRVLIGEVEV